MKRERCGYADPPHSLFMMRMVPNFAPRSTGTAIFCRYRPTAADMDCRYCLEHRRRGCRSLTCLYLTERLAVGAVTLEELIAETARPWKHLPLKQRAMHIAGQIRSFCFVDQLHVRRMMEMTKGEKEAVNSRWLAAVYLLSAHAALWQKTLAAVMPDQINFASVRLGGSTVQDYVLYRAAKGICSGMLGATSEELADIKDLINLTFCCQQATVITDFSDLEAVGRAHYMDLNGGCTSREGSENLDGIETARRLIDGGGETVTPYGVVYDNGMRLEQVYNGAQLPAYCYDQCIMMLGISPEYCPKEGQKPEYLYFPASTGQIKRALLRAGIDTASGPRIWVEINELPEKVAEALDLEDLSGADLPALNRLCRAIAPMKDADLKKLNAVVLTAGPGDMMAVCQLAENLDQFNFIPGIHTPEEYGRYMIRESGHFEYDENLEDFYNYRHYGEQRIREEGGQFNECGYVAYHGTLTLEGLMREDPAELQQQEQDFQMGGFSG